MKKYIIILPLLIVAVFFIYSRSGYIPLDPGSNIDSIVIIKSANHMLVFQQRKLLHTYEVAIGRHDTGAKEQEGDQKTPEGKYMINDKNPHSGFYKNLGISYPNTIDQQRSEQLHVPPGGQIKIHGLKNGLGWIGRWHQLFNWTNGCVAVTNREMDDLFRAIHPGAKLIIKP